MAVDICGKELKVGQKVAFVSPHYRDLRTARIDRITDHTVFLNDKRQTRRGFSYVVIVEDV